MDDYLTLISISVAYALVAIAALGGLVWAEVLDGRHEQDPVAAPVG